MATAQRLQEQMAELRAAREEMARLHIQAEFDGQWVDVNRLLRPGGWLGVKEPVGVLADPSGWVVDAYVEQRMVARIEPGARARFLPEGGLRTVGAEVLSVDSTRAQRLAHPMLDSRHGGDFTTLPDGEGAVPGEALYRVRLRLDEAPGHPREQRGQVRIEGGTRSLAWEGAKGVLAVLVRESGF